MKKRTALLLKLIVSVAALSFILSQLDLKVVGKVIASAKLSSLVPAFLLSLLLPAINALKIKVLLPGSTVGYHYILFTNFASGFIKLAIPTDFGAELGRAYYLGRRTGSAAAVSAIVIDRYLGFCSQALVVAVVAVIATFAGGPVFWKQVAFVAVGVFVAAMAAPAVFCRIPIVPRSKKKWLVGCTSALARFSEALLAFRVMRLRLLFAALVSIIATCVALAMIVILSSAFHESLAFREASVITFLSSIACLLPSFAGLGLVEGIYTGMYHFFSRHQEIGFAVSITSRLFALALAVPGVIFILAGNRLFHKPEQPDPDGAVSL